MYLRYEDTEISFKINETTMEVIATKIINRRRFKITKKLTTNSISYLWKILDNLSKLPEEFWKLDE